MKNKQKNVKKNVYTTKKCGIIGRPAYRRTESLGSIPVAEADPKRLLNVRGDVRQSVAVHYLSSSCAPFTKFLNL